MEVIPSMPHLPSIPGDAGVVDLGEIKRRADERDALEVAARVEREREQAIARIVSKDRAMQRAFKGIVTRRERRRLIARSLTRTMAEAAA
jgi:hypothetical protein